MRIGVGWSTGSLVSRVSSNKDVDPINEGPIPRILFNYFLRGVIFKYSHTKSWSFNIWLGWGENLLIHSTDMFYFSLMRSEFRKECRYWTLSESQNIPLSVYDKLAFSLFLETFAFPNLHSFVKGDFTTFLTYIVHKFLLNLILSILYAMVVLYNTLIFFKFSKWMMLLNKEAIVYYTCSQCFTEFSICVYFLQLNHFCFISIY